MNNFQKWYKKVRDKNEITRQFQEKLDKQNIAFPKHINTLISLEKFIDERVSDRTARDELKLLARKVWEEYLYDTKSVDGSELFCTISRPIILMLIAVFMFVVIWLALFYYQDFKVYLGNAQFARGLITFLFAFGTIGIAVIIALSVFTSEADPDEAKQRFYRAKEILTILIGILGTIVGFYFGSSNDQAPPLNVSEIRVNHEDDQLTAGHKIFLSAAISGGRTPYTCSFEFKADGNRIDAPDATGLELISGLVAYGFQTPGSVSSDDNAQYTLDIELIVKDSAQTILQKPVKSIKVAGEL